MIIETQLAMRDKEFELETAKDFASARNIGEEISPTAQARQKTRVLMVGMHLTKTRGGISTLVAEILKSPLNDDCEFCYVASQAEDFGGVGKLGLAARALIQFVYCCVCQTPEIVYVHVGSNASLYRESLFIILAKIFGLKVVAHFHAGDIDNYFPRQTAAGQSFIRRAINSSDGLIAVSQESARQLRLLAASPIVAVIPNAIETAVFDAGNRAARIENEENPTRLLFVGAIGKLKGERDLIRALAILRERGCQCSLKVSILGYGAESLAPICAAAGVADYIEFLGAVALEERIEFFRQADIFVLPTYAEAMPMSVIEAMAAGLPIISTSVGGIPEMIENNVDGLLFAPGDVVALADKIQFLLANKAVQLELGAKARRKAVQEFDIAQYVEKLRQFLPASRCENEQQ